MKYSIFDVLQVKSFASLWISELFTQVSVNIFNFYLILVVFSLTRSNTAVAGVILSFTIPSIFLGVIAGVHVDRWDKKKVLLITNIIRGFLLIILALFHKSLFAIYSISFLFAVVSQFFIPAETPMIPLIVKEKLLLPANALFGLGIYGSILLAYVLSGPILIFFGRVNTLIFLAGLLFISCMFISAISLLKQQKKTSPLSVQAAVRSEVREAVRFAFRSIEIRHSLFFLALSQVLILVISALAPGYASQVLKVRIVDFPMLFVAPAALGVLLGAILIGSFLQKINKERLITIGLFLSGFAMLILPYGSRLAAKGFIVTVNMYLPSFLNIDIMHIVIAMAFLLGFANAFVFVPSNTILQEKTTDAMRGKIYGVLNMLVGFFSLLPLLLVGGLSDLIGVSQVLIGIGICLLVLGAGKMYFKL